jgi:hypothetical protein
MILASTRRRSPGASSSAGCAAAALTSLALSCGSGSNGAPTIQGAPLDAGVTADAGTMRFDAPEILEASPASTVSINLDADVTGAISLSLDGDYADASLADAYVTASAGVAAVVVRTPSMATTFGIHARSASGATADLAVDVSAAGYTSVGIHPTYSGVRTVGPVVASAFINTTCALLTATPLNDAVINASGLPGAELTLDEVPAGANIAVYGRIGHYAAGCIDAGILATGKAQELDLPIYDLPMALSATDLVVTLTPVAAPGSPELAYWTSVLGRGHDAAVASFNDGESDEAALLDEMGAQVPTASQADFTAQRAALGWDATTATWLGAHLASLVSPASSLSAQVSAVLAAAVPRALGPVVFGLAQASNGTAQVSPSTVDGVSASAAGWLAPAAFAWTADAHDNVQLSGAFFVQASATLAAVAVTSSDSADIPGTLAMATTAGGIDCAGLSMALTSAGDSYPGCPADCTTMLCRAALEAMWIRAGNASESSDQITQVALVASGVAAVGDAAQPVSFAGNWVSQINTPMVGAGDLDGTASAGSK